MARALVTGAGGFIGTHLCTALLSRGDEVHALVRPGSSAPPGTIPHEADIADEDAIAAIFTSARPEKVFHLAASNVRVGITAPAEEVMRTNVLGTRVLLEAAAAEGVSSFVSMGSFLEYGPKTEQAREDMRPEPLELYSVSKLAGTLLTQAYGRTGKVPSVALRLFTPYGPGMQEKRLVREALTRSLRGEPLSLTSPDISRDFVYIDDIVALLLEAGDRAKEHSGKIFNLGSGTKTTLREFAELVQETTGKETDVEWGSFDAVLYDSDAWQADMRQTFSAFSWRPGTTLRDGLRKTSEWIAESSKG